MTRASVHPALRTGSVRRTTGRRAVALLAVGSLLVLGACGTDDDGEASPTPTPTESESPSPTESSSPSPTAEPVTSAVYYVVDTRAGLRLAREVRELAGGSTEETVTAAVEAMIAGAEDPDYTTTWNPDTEVLAVSRELDGIAVVLSEEARTANVGSEGAAQMIQQLVYTVTEATEETAAVQLLIDDEPAGELWGSVTWDEPIARADPMDVRMMVQIDFPTEGAVASSPLTVQGEANAFEANVPWQVVDDLGEEVDSGFTTAAEGMTFSPFEFTVELEPGTYTVIVNEDDPSDGEAGEPMQDTRTVVIE